MEVLAREKAESERAALQQRVKELEEQMLEERLARERQNHESNSQHGSTSRHQVVRVFHFDKQSEFSMCLQPLL
jgi:hypothetical protein